MRGGVAEEGYIFLVGVCEPCQHRIQLDIQDFIVELTKHDEDLVMPADTNKN